MEMPERSSRVVIGAAVVVLGGALVWLGLGRRGDKGPPSAGAPAQASAKRSRPSARQNTEARRARDAMRAQIVSELERKRSAAAASATAKAPPREAPSQAPPARAAASDEDRPKGHYDPKYIQKHVREDIFPLLRECYEEALSRRPKLGGKLILTFTIAGDPSVGGIVEEADFAEESSIQDEEMRTCVRESLMTLTFEKPPEGGGYVTVRYPIEFSADDEDAATGATSGGASMDAGTGTDAGGDER